MRTGSLQSNTSGFRDWKDVEHAASLVVAESPDPFDPATIQNVQDIISAIPKLCPLPDDVVKGYWSTIRICWKNGEIEIFDDRYEQYRFVQGKAEIEYFERVPKATVPSDLVDRLSKIGPIEQRS